MSVYLVILFINTNDVFDIDADVDIYALLQILHVI
jgi:hypothetical protein